MRAITLPESDFEHLLNCLANQKFIEDVNADGISEGLKKVRAVQNEMQLTIDIAWHKGMALLNENRKYRVQTDDKVELPDAGKQSPTI